MNKIFLLAIVSLISTQAFAASERLYSCKGTSESAEKGLKTFRINILSGNGKTKATFSEGYTTMNTLFTWTVEQKDKGGKIVFTNPEATEKKPAFKLEISKNKSATVEDVSGQAAEAELEFWLKPFGEERKDFEIVDGKLACKEGK